VNENSNQIWQQLTLAGLRKTFNFGKIYWQEISQ